jgi:hypothetical protein
METLENNPHPELQPYLQSLQGMHRAQAPERVFARVMEEMKRPVAKMVPISRISLAAACILLLIGLNIVVLANKQSTAPGAETTVGYYGTSSQYGYSY